MASAPSALGEEIVRASHILIKHEGSRRKAFWKGPEGQVISATTRTDAAACLGELRAQILAGRASFADLVAKDWIASSAPRRRPSNHKRPENSIPPGRSSSAASYDDELHAIIVPDMLNLLEIYAA
ncbi:hypothetical protein ZWY2020_006896 [Hordeum vulgare]|nr:hypothetical protein ZWY2020_006896 [Hordeum vulgare]